LSGSGRGCVSFVYHNCEKENNNEDSTKQKLTKRLKETNKNIRVAQLTYSNKEL